MGELTLQGIRKESHYREWYGRIQVCRSSGLSVNRWCNENGVNRKTYYTWQTKIFSAMMEQQDAMTGRQEGTIVEITPADPLPTSGPAASLRTRTMTLDIYPSASPELIDALCRTLRHVK